MRTVIKSKPKTLGIVVSALLALCIFCGVFLSHPFLKVSAESLYIRKIVSVVYDDSGSMKGDKWAYANYAMQTFCGMLNSDDQLYITYMSYAKKVKNYSPERIDLSAGEIQSSVDSIRSHGDTSSTPYTAVEIAYDKLKSISDSNRNTQYWLVIITDGAFDECNGMTVDDGKRFLNEKVLDFTKDVMPNGTNPQVTFLGIGQVVSPDENRAKGIYTYSANDARGIINAMADMADRVSGRTRLQGDRIKKTGAGTIEVTSTIPLLNIAVLTQDSDAQVVRATRDNENEIPISRKASLKYPRYSDLVGSASLLGDSKNVIGFGTYKIEFDHDVDISDVVVLFEPALEMRMSISLNGREITDFGELDKTEEGDKVAVSCKIYEMGTDKEVGVSLMPPGTRFEITVAEDGNVAARSSGNGMSLPEYTLNNIETEIKAAMTIEGFNPIVSSARFTPAEFGSGIKYTIVPEFINGIKSVRIGDVAGNKDPVIGFTVYADGAAITDPEAVKTLGPTIGVSPQGNNGDVTYSDDGKILFTPNAAAQPSAGIDRFDVEVTCSLPNGASASEKYTVLIADYQIVVIPAAEKIAKTEFYGNKTGVSFYIMKDGVKLDKKAIENDISVSLNEERAELKTDVAVTPDGTVTVTPYSDEERELTFGRWWTNWAYYFGLSGDDVVVSLSHPFGSADGTIDVVGAGAKYVILNVILPLLLEVVLLAAIIAYIVRYFTKARFATNAALYVGYIDIAWGVQDTHRMSLSEYDLNEYNKFKYLWNPFKELQATVGGVMITAAHGGVILCNERLPWYSSSVTPKSGSITIDSPKDVVCYCAENNGDLAIREIKPTTVMENENERRVYQSEDTYYFVDADLEERPGRIRRIVSAKCFCYSVTGNQ